MKCSTIHMLAIALLAASQASASAADETQAAPASGVRRALVICGLAGDADHRTLYAGTLETLYTGLTQHHGFTPEHVTVLWSDEPQTRTARP